MKIAKRRFINPDRNFWYGIVAVAISVFVFAYSIRFGQVSILAYYALWLPLVLLDYRHVLGNYAKFYWIVAFVLFACLSLFWSAAPGVTARASVQYMSHIVCALIAARTVNIRTLTLGALVGIFAVLLYSLAFGEFQYDAFDDSFSFTGAFSSKNQLGFYASLGIYFAFVDILVFRERGLWRIATLIIAGLSAYMLVLSQSATSVIATAATLAAMICFGAILRFAPNTRKGILLIGAVVAIVGAFAALNMGAMDIILGAFGKDSTLTGRTYLWSEGLAAARESPLVGIGYQAYWVQGFPEAERLWEEFFITTRSGFHFHNTYIEVMVELGLVGLVLISLVMLATLAGHLNRILNDGNNLASRVMLGVGIMLLIRSFSEVDVITPYTIGAFLLYYSAGLLASSQAAWAPAAHANRPKKRRRPAEWQSPVET